MDESVRSIEARLVRLEARCRRLRAACAALGLLVLAACTAAALAPGDPVVRAARFEVVGAEGETVAVLAADLCEEVPAAGLRIGRRGEAVALLASVPVEDGGNALILQLRTGVEGSGAEHTTFVGEDRVTEEMIVDGHREIETWVEPMESCFHFRTCGGAEDGRTVLELLDSRGSPSVLAHGNDGEVSFEFPRRER